MAKGFKQEKSIVFDEVFLPFVKMNILKSVLALVECEFVLGECEGSVSSRRLT